jgi:hypothetical protein
MEIKGNAFWRGMCYNKYVVRESVSQLVNNLESPGFVPPSDSTI